MFIDYMPRVLALEIVKNMSPERHLFVSRRHRASFRATVMFSDYRDPVDLEDFAICTVLAEFLQGDVSLFQWAPGIRGALRSAGELAPRQVAPGGCQVGRVKA